MANVARTFKMWYTNGLGERILERPRLAITADGRHKSLVVGTHTVLATARVDAPDAELWARAREAVALIAGSKGN
jgi:hypothetical protein